jgi:pimeloyl-ACP methyl ester carboxylesterase
MAEREVLSVAADGGSLGGWIAGEGPPVLLLHGGPGLNHTYLDALGGELTAEFRVASYQQRGLDPSTLEGPFTVAQSIADAVAVLDGLDWPRAWVVGHSWGAHLALRLAAEHPDRLLGALAVDPIGVVGDGGNAAFEAEMSARTPMERRSRAKELDERELAGEGTDAEFREAMEIWWPAYFADPQRVPPMPPMRTSVPAYAGISAELLDGLDEVAARLAGEQCRYAVLAGAASPIPWGQAGLASAELSSRGSLIVVPGAGHFPWFEQPGCVLAALRQLAAETSPERDAEPVAE